MPIFFDKLLKELKNQAKYKFEVIFINNASKDNSLFIVKNLIKTYKEGNVDKFKLISFTRNFGYQKSLLAGYKYSSGETSIVIDTDLEDPVEMIPKFIEKWQEGYEVVYGKRVDRVENWLIKKFRNFFYKILKLSSDFEINDQMAEFCLISKKVREQIININPTFTFFRSEIAFLGLKSFPIEYKRDKRIAGKTNYNFFGMVQFAVTGFLTTSTFLLRFFAYSFSLLVIVNILGLLFFSKMLGILIVIDILYLCLNISLLSLYIARIYQIGIKRPPYIIDIENSIL